MLTVIKAYADETQHGDIIYDPEIAVATLWDYIHNPDCQIIIEYIENRIAGGMIIFRQRQFTTRYFGHINKFYVLPEFRGTRTARSLMAQAVEWFDKNDCVCSYTGSDARVGEDKLFMNLIGKFGFKPGNKSYIREGK